MRNIKIVRFFVPFVTLISVIIIIINPEQIAGAQAGKEPKINWEEWDVVPGRLIVQFSPQRSNAIESNLAGSRSFGLTLTQIEEPVEQAMEDNDKAGTFRSILPDTYIGEFDPLLRDAVLASLESDSDVIYFEPERIRISQTSWGTDSPNDYDAGILWGLDRTGAPNAWALQTPARANVQVAVMEERFSDTHNDLQAQVTLRNNTNPISDHATHVAGTIAATGNNGQDVVGMANVELISLTWGDGITSFVQALSWANSNGIDVINMSFKRCGDDGIDNGPDCDKCLYTAESTTEQNAIDNVAGNIVLVASAGNDSCSQDPSGRGPLPASYNNVIAVSAIDNTDALATFSNFGNYVGFTAPGVNIQSTVVTGTQSMDGTSMAAPHVSGSAGAILAIDQNFDAPSVRRLLELTAEDIGTSGRDDIFGQGIVRIDRAADGIADVYAESDSDCGVGTLDDPFCTFSSAINDVPTGGTIGLVGGSVFNETTTFSKPTTIISVGGLATIGQ